MKAVDLFAGGGGVSCGLLKGGISHIDAIEYNPKHPELSKQFAEIHHRNFGDRSKLHLKTIQSMAANNFSGIEPNPYLIWASPVCTEFSVAKAKTMGQKETKTDIEMAIAVSEAITKLQPKYFCLENVVAYGDPRHKSLQIIYRTLDLMGYDYQPCRVNFSDYGIPQDRERFILLAWAEGEARLRLPPQQRSPSWYLAVKDKTNFLQEIKLTKRQLESFEPKLKELQGSYLIQRVGSSPKLICRHQSQSVWTITKYQFIDNKSNGRGKVITLFNWPTQKFYTLPVSIIKRFCGFPEHYWLPNNPAIAGSAIGLAVPPLFVANLVKFHLTKVDNEVESQKAYGG
ncbi:MAG: hypothetical protein F6K24_03555 [Okeania sp. SIO2D1]|nr:hypothetical protein [Okeania sp. SIO2D1]